MALGLAADATETTNVIVCGCGPTGAMLSALLGRYGVKNIVLERDLEVNVDPRGIALDEDGIRNLQSCGIYDKVFTEIGQCMRKFYFVGGTHHDLMTKPFMVMDYNTTEGGTGHPGFICHKQPAIEKNLRAQVTGSSYSDLRLGYTVVGIREDADWVYATYKDPAGQEREVRGRFLVGADGKTGFTRKQYLEPKAGITMERVAETAYDETWVALNWHIRLPTPETHPDFPLWPLGYTPEEVFDLFFPINFRFLCNPQRPAVCGRFGLDADRLWRFEFVVLPGEDGTAMSGPDKIRAVVFPYITHPASRYKFKNGHTGAIQYPEDCIDVLRSRPFNFSARSCNEWSSGRVVICGDAAHVFPPFGGQGITSGFRDASSLAWRLVLATQPVSGPASDRPDYRRLLEGWHMERKQQLDKSLASTIENGTYVTNSNALSIFMRDWYLWAVRLIPSWRHWLELGNRREGMAKYAWQADAGMAFLPDLHGGGNFPQVYCRRVVPSNSAPSPVRFTDDVIFSDKKGLFQLVVFLDSLEDIKSTREATALLDKASLGSLLSSEATVILSETKTPASVDTQETGVVYRLATGDEFAADELLCKGRPKPIYYDAFRIRKETGYKPYIILRPDRFVFAACQNKDELQRAAHTLSKLLLGRI